MLKIAICDDERTQARKIETLLKTYLQNHSKLPVQIQWFQSGTALLEQAEACGGFDLYFLDVIMPNLNGIETGLRLRKLGETGEIIYLTVSGDYAVDSYQVRAFFYLLKPVDEAHLFAVLESALQKLKNRRAAVLVSSKDGLRRILLEDILYVERVGRRVRYHCTHGQVDSLSIRVPFREAVEPLLTQAGFYSCGASFVFHFLHITNIRGQTAQLDNGETVMLPRTAAAAFKSAWGNYWLGLPANSL